MSDIFRLGNGRSRAINAENPTGEKGKGGIAASHLGPSRKGSPCLKNIMPNETVVLAEMMDRVLFSIYGLRLIIKHQMRIVMYSVI